jgi:thiosulfate/3-mercaptopyruvate sulfurtransferase
MTVSEPQTLVSSEWMAVHAGDPKVRLIEIAGMGQENLQAYKAGHVPGAVAWKWKEALWDSHMREFPSPAEFAKRLGEAGIGNDTTVVFYGEGIQFGIYAWWVFRYCGHPDVRVLDGGRDRWRGEGRPLTTDEAPKAAPVSYRPVERREEMRIGRDGILAALDDGATILDGRSPEEYNGTRVGGPGGPDVGALRYGRIPGAKHVYFAELFEPDNRFKSAAELAAMFPVTAGGGARDIITYCRMSHRATVLHFALTQLLGHRRVRVYDGSWTEWGNLVGVPIER